jgi:hypothetical protein
MNVCVDRLNSHQKQTYAYFQNHKKHPIIYQQHPKYQALVLMPENNVSLAGD